MSKPWQNREGYSDPTVYEGLKPGIREDAEREKRVSALLGRLTPDIFKSAVIVWMKWRVKGVCSENGLCPPDGMAHRLGQAP